MPALQLTVTTAGRAALPNAQNNGTESVRLAAVGVTATAFTPGATTASLPGEIKRIDTLAGGATASDTLHVTIRDDSSDTYSVTGLALYLDDGTLFASYSQANALLQKSAQATMLLALDVQFADINATTITVGDTDFQLNAATTEAQGIVELATDAETTAGADAQRVVVPKGLKAAIDARLGAGAPSTFVKTLLTAATAAAFRTLLALKTAATYDIGAGNGLDADLLDGQQGTYYRQWANLQGVPASFPPSAHQHSADDITSGTLAVARGGTGAGTFAAGSYLLGNGTKAFALKTPAQVLTDIGAAAKVHSHAWGDINNPPATATRWPAVAEVTGLTDALAAKLGKSETATAATKLATARNIKLTGTVKGNADFDGSANISIGTSIDDGALSIAKTNGLQDALDEKLPSSGGDLSGPIYLRKGGVHFGTGSASIYEDDTSYPAPALIIESPNGERLFRFQDDGSLVVANGGMNVNGVIYAQGSSDCSLRAAPTGGHTIGLASTNVPNKGIYDYTQAEWLINFHGGHDATFSGAVIATNGFQNSDRRLKKAIRHRVVQDGLAKAIADHFSEWVLKSNGHADVGLIAQDVQRIAPHYVIQSPSGYLAIDKAGIALECAMDLAMQVTDLQETVSDLLTRIAALENHA